jgi:hypothetical protein
LARAFALWLVVINAACAANQAAATAALVLFGIGVLLVEPLCALALLLLAACQRWIAVVLAIIAVVIALVVAVLFAQVSVAAALLCVPVLVFLVLVAGALIYYNNDE